MPIIPNNGFFSAARIASQPGGQYALQVVAEENDNKVRQAAPGFDGMERPFVMVPFDNGAGGLDWQRFGMTWAGTDGYASDWDVYQAQDVPLTPAQAKTVAQNGIAFGMDTNVGTLWAQEPGKNLYPAIS